MKQGSIAQALAANTAVQVIGKVVSTALGVVVVGILTRLLGTEGFGKYSTANAFLQVFGILMDLGLNVLLVQMLGENAGDQEKENRIISALFTLRVVMASIILTLGVGLAYLVPSYDFELKLAITAIWGSFFFTLLNQVVIGVHQRHLKMHVVAMAEVAGRVTLLIGILIAVARGWGLVPVVLMVSLGGFINFLVNFSIASRFADFHWNVDLAFWKTALRRAWPIGISILFSLIYYKADTLVLSWVRPQAEVGVYGAAYRILEILVTLPFMYAGVLLPLLAKAWKDQKTQHFHTLVQRSFDAMMIVTMPLIFGTLAVGPNLIRLVMGDEFIQSGDVLRVLIVATGAIFIATVFSHAVVALNAQKEMLPWYIWTAIVTLIGYIVLIPTYGMWAAAWLTVASELAILIGNILVVIRRATMRIDWVVPLKSFGAALILFFIAWMLAPVSLFLAIIGGAVVYGILMFLTGALTPEIVHELLRSRKGVPMGDESI
jgi:O-antigen/teichoic acid export membrane protein